MRKLIKKKMIDDGREDFINFLAEITGITRQTAASRLSGRSDFTEKEMFKVFKKLNFTAEEIQEIIEKEC